ncbi:MAG: sigma-70 family RNA polymerase sigma factor [Oscillospiraceae bacterium]|nr:sigma-70 family RNA polymerase sigma factor [Oscillospiraceae bacterium]
MQDEGILQLYWNRDEQAIEETAAKYGAYCNSIAWNILYNREDCQECVNDTWLQAWNIIPPQRPQRLRAFLGKITRNLAFDRYKAQNTKKRGGELEFVLYELAQCIAFNESLEERVSAEELKRLVNDFVRNLPDRERNVFVRRYFFVESAAQIGQRYQTSAGNVMVILSRTRKKLRAFLEKEGYLP